MAQRNIFATLGTKRVPMIKRQSLTWSTQPLGTPFIGVILFICWAMDIAAQ